jgi:hypothetical protein
MEKRTLTSPLSRTEGFSHIENYYRSGLRPSQYCKQHGITEWQFYSWRKRYLREHPAIEPPAIGDKVIHRIRIDEGSDHRVSGLEIHYPHGVKVVIASHSSIEIEKLRLLIQLQV